MLGLTDAEWQKLLSKHDNSDNFVMDVITDFMNQAEEVNQMEQDQYGEE